MDEIGKEETALETQIDELRGKIGGADSIGETVSSAEALLAELRKRLDAPVAWEQKRRLAERSLRPASPAFPEVLFQIEILVVDAQARVNSVLDHVLRMG